MTVSDAIERAEGLYKYCEAAERFPQWLSELEDRIGIELFHTEKQVDLSYDTVLTAPNAYAELYPLYLAMKSAFAEGRSERYNDFARSFERAYSEYIDYVNRTKHPAKAVYFKIL